MSIDKSLNLSEFSNHDELHESTARKHGDAAAQLATISGAMMACRGGGQTGGWRGPGDQTPVGSLSWCIKESWAPSSGAVATGKWSMDDASDGLVSSPSRSTASAARHPPRHSLHICGSLLAQFGYIHLGHKSVSLSHLVITQQSGRLRSSTVPRWLPESPG